jgi:hypothetical protein
VVIDTAKLKISTKSMVAAVFTLGSLLQIGVVHDYVLSLAHDHPHVVAFTATITGIYGLLHNPEVQDALGIKRTVEVKETTEEVSLAKPESSK